MATSVRNLLAAVDAETWGTSTPQYVADDAIAALRHIARALDRLAYDGLDPTVGGIREQSVYALTAACTSLTRSWPAAGSGRITDLVGAAADIVSQLRADGSREDRWALSTAFADTARRLLDTITRHEPYRTELAFNAVANHARTIGQIAIVDAPAPHQRALLDYTRPIPDLPAGMSGSEVAAESIIAVTAILRGAPSGRSAPITILDADVCLRIAEQMAHYAANLAPINHPTADTPDQSHASAAAWLHAQHSLLPFDDGTRFRRRPSDLVGWTGRAYDGIRRSCGPLAHLTPMTLRTVVDLDTVTTHLRTITNQLPDIADQLSAEIRAWAESGRLRAPATAVRARVDRLRQRATNQPVIADLIDLLPTLDALRDAATQSAALAVTLDQTAPHLGRHHQPDLVASLSTRLNTTNMGCSDTAEYGVETTDSRWFDSSETAYNGGPEANPD